MDPDQPTASVVEDPTERPPSITLDAYRIEACLSHGELWLRDFELGGMSSELELEAVLYGALEPSQHEYEVIALALNERFIELGNPQHVPYEEDAPDIPGAPDDLE